MSIRDSWAAIARSAALSADWCAHHHAGRPCVGIQRKVAEDAARRTRPSEGAQA